MPTRLTLCLIRTVPSGERIGDDGDRRIHQAVFGRNRSTAQQPCADRLEEVHRDAGPADHLADRPGVVQTPRHGERAIGQILQHLLRLVEVRLGAQRRQQQYQENRTELGDRNQQAAAQHDTRTQRREPVRAEHTVGRNDPCPCGSGKKFKNCHGKNL